MANESPGISNFRSYLEKIFPMLPGNAINKLKRFIRTQNIDDLFGGKPHGKPTLLIHYRKMEKLISREEPNELAKSLLPLLRKKRLEALQRHHAESRTRNDLGKEELMPHANCQACVLSKPTLANPKGSQNEPFGSCQNCHSLACGHHGHRDGNVPEFICVECDPHLLAASAVVTAAASPRLESILVGYHRYALPISQWRVTSVDDFVRRRPGYGSSFIERIPKARLNFDQQWEDTSLRDPLAALPDNEKQLLAVAILITVRFELQNIPEFLRQIKDHFEG